MIKYLLLSLSMLSAELTQAQNIGIGTIIPDSSARLDVVSTNQGFLPPRLTYTQRNNIQHPAAGLIIWCIECAELQVYNGAGWKNMIGGASCANYVPAVVTCNQVWMTKNLDVLTYRNGDSIRRITNAYNWENLTTGGWCWYNFDSVNYAATYGKMYNWYAVNDSRGLAPSGWHIPSNAEWTTLGTCLGGDSIAGHALKEAGLTHWVLNNISTTNSSGFTALPGGFCSYDGTCVGVGSLGFWWSSTPYLPTSIYMRSLVNDTGLLGSGSTYFRHGLYVRCVKD